MIISSGVNTSAIKCKVSPNDKIPLLDYFIRNNIPIDPFIVACDANHFSDFVFDQFAYSFKAGPRTNTIEGIENNRSRGIQAIPGHLIYFYEQAKSFLVASKVEGSSVYLRALIEFLVNENFAVIYKNNRRLNLKSQQDNNDFENTLKYFDKIGISTALEIMSGNIFPCGSSFRRRTIYGNRKAKINFLSTNACNFINYISLNSKSSKMLDNILSWKLFTAYVDLSESIHGRRPPTLGRLDIIYEDILASYEDYIFIRSNTWMVIP